MLNNRKKTLGVFVCKLPEYFQRTLCGALADEAVANGYNLVVFSTFGEYDNNHDYVEGESNCLYIPNYDELDGIILCLDVFDIPGMAGKLIEQVKEKAHCPVISIRQKRDEFISVLSDDKKAIMAMVDHLVDEHNAKRIYYLSGPSYMHDIRMREDGFRERMKSRGVAFREEYIFMGNLWYNIGKEAVDYFLSLDDERPDAILCANDYMAISVCEELCDRGFRVPEDIIVTGFDDVEEARDIYPMLTTVEACPENFARCAMEIIKKAERGEKLEKQYYISTQNQYRNSCGCKEAEEIEVLAQNFVNEVNEVNISWNKEFFIEVRYGWFVKEVGTISSTDECIRSAKMKMKVGAQMQTSAAKYAFEVMKEIRQNYQKEISVTYMAEQFGISRTHLSHCFKLIYQKSIQDYITSYRMEKAQELLIHTQKKIKEIAFLVGYKDELYFSKVFARLYGMSPSKFRKTMLT